MKIKFILPSIFSVALLASCGITSTSDITNVVSDVVEVATGFNDADVMFAQMMIPHHEQAIEMSDIALDPTVGAGDAVKSLATRIKGSQDPEIAQMTGFLSGWQKALTMDGSMDHSSMMSGMLSADEITKLGTLRGVEFDRAWMTGMIAHHEGAIDMANDVLKNGKNEKVRTLATAIVSAQDIEIAEMKQLLG